MLRLSALYQMNVVTKKLLASVSDADASIEDWISLLDVSYQHRLPEARGIAVHKLESKLRGDPARKIVLARQYGIGMWLLDGLLELVEREAYPSDDEEKSLGAATIIKLFRAREVYTKRPLEHRLIIADGFKSEVQQMEAGRRW